MDVTAKNVELQVQKNRNNLANAEVATAKAVVAADKANKVDTLVFILT